MKEIKNVTISSKINFPFSKHWILVIFIGTTVTINLIIRSIENTTPCSKEIKTINEVKLGNGKRY